MAFTDFYLNQLTGSSNLNAGSTTSDVGGGSDAAIYTSTAGNWDGTSVFTPTDSSTPANTISAGMYVSLYNTGDTACRAVAKISSIGAGVNGTITIDTATKYGTVPTSNSGSRALKCGGAWADLGICAANAPLNTGTIPQSTRVNVKAATYANTTTTRQIGILGTATLALWVRGYKTTPGDQDNNNVAVAGTDIPYFTFTTARMTVPSHTRVTALAITSADTSGNAAFQAGTFSILYNLQVTNTAANASGIALIIGAQATMSGCYFQATTTATKAISGTTYSTQGCIVNGGIIGIAASGGGVNDSIFYGQAGDSIALSASPFSVINCSIYAPGGNGINITSLGANSFLIANNYFSTVNQAAKSAINNTSGANSDSIVCVGNAYFNCTANITGVTESFTILDNGTLASEACVAPASQNFAVGKIAQNLGFPGNFPTTAAYRGYMNVGAVQSQATIPGATAWAY